MNNNFGSFGALSPDEMSAIRSALERRGMGDSAPLLNQQSQSSATPAPIPPQAQGGIAPSPQMGGGGEIGASISPEMQMGTPVGSPEAELIIKALNQRLQSLSKVEQAQVGIA